MRRLSAKRGPHRRVGAGPGGARSGDARRGDALLADAIDGDRQAEAPGVIRTRVEDLAVPGLTRMDMHCHSRASNGPAIAALGFIDCPECFSPPERVFDQAIARGMDLVTITDHDTIDGAVELADRGFERFVVGEEVTVFFPEDRCKLHVLVWDLTPDLHEQIGRLELRDDVYAFAHWLHEHNLPHSVAHPLYVQNGRLTRWHVERCVLLFKCFEVLNGAHPGTHRGVIDRYLDGLTASRVQLLVEDHGLDPVWPRSWHKGRTGGSDDHGLLNVGKAWTAVQADAGSKPSDAKAFLRRVMSGASEPGGVAGHSSLLAHQLTTVGAHYYSGTLYGRAGPKGRYLASKLLRFAGVRADRPSRASVALDTARSRLLAPRKRPLPIVRALKQNIGPMLDRYPELRGRLDPAMWVSGAPISDHDRMAAFVDDLCDALSRAMSAGALDALRDRDKLGIVDHLISYLVVHLAQLPYLVSLFHQNKERPFVERFEHETSDPGSGLSVLERPMRVSLFTDTLGDINGVCRFIQNVAQQAMTSGRDLQVITSTRLKVPNWDNIYNFEPVFAATMPRYENLEFVLPPLMRVLRHLDRHQPDAIHISTPGPIGLVGYLAARMLRVPILGVYHTDFPAYIDHLFEDHAFTYATGRFMHLFYAPFHTIFTRSEDYVQAVSKLGIDRRRVRSLMPGVDTDLFHPRHKDLSVWSRFEGVSPTSVKVLYVGRVSTEKNMPLLTRVWKKAATQCLVRDVEAELIMVGDGPYRQRMQKELRGAGVHFLGFRHGEELSALYASSDLFVFPSTTDTLGQVVMESQASGLPVLVTGVGGPKEVVRDGKTGRVLPADNPDAWVDAIAAMVVNHEQRRQMGAAAHHEMQPYSIRNSFEHFWEVHEQAWREHLASVGISRPERNARPAGEEARHPAS